MKNKKMAYCASFAALATVFLVIGFYFQLFDIFCYFIGSLCLAIPVKLSDIKYSVITHITICLATLIFTGFYFFYTLPFFLVGFITLFASKIKNKMFRFAFGCTLFEIALFIYMFLMGEAIKINNDIDHLLPIFIYLFGIPFYLLIYKTFLNIRIKLFNLLGIE